MCNFDILWSLPFMKTASSLRRTNTQRQRIQNLKINGKQDVLFLGAFQLADTTVNKNSQ